MYQRWVLITCLVGVFATSFPVTMLTVALSTIAEDLDTSETTIAWVVSAPMLAGAVAMPLFGRMGDLLGQRRVFLAGFALFALTSAATAGAWSPLSLIGFRTLTQLIGSATAPTSMALIMWEMPRRERAQAMGWMTLVGAGAPALGLVVGGPLVEMIGWRPVFMAQAVFALAAVMVAWFVLEEAPAAGADRHFDFAGAITMGLSVGGLMFALTQGRAWGWGDPRVLTAAALFPLAGIAFFYIEKRGVHPLLPVSLMTRPAFYLPVGAEFLSSAAYNGAFVMTPLLLQGVLDWPVSSVALLMLIRPVALSLSSPLGGRATVVFGEFWTSLIGVTLLMVSMGVFVAGSLEYSVVLIGVALLFQGIGTGIHGPPLGAMLVNSVSDDDIGMVSATQRMIQQTGNAVGISLLIAIYGGEQSATAFARAYGVAAVVAGLALFIVFAFRRYADQGSRRTQRQLAAVGLDGATASDNTAGSENGERTSDPVSVTCQSRD